MTGQLFDLEEQDRFSAIEKKARITSRRSKNTQELLKQHIKSCDAKQTWVLRIGTVTLAWLVLHSPEAAKAAMSLAKVMFP